MHRGILLEMPALRSPCGPFESAVCGKPARARSWLIAPGGTFRWSAGVPIAVFPTHHGMTRRHQRAIIDGGMVPREPVLGAVITRTIFMTDSIRAACPASTQPLSRGASAADIVAERTRLLYRGSRVPAWLLLLTTLVLGVVLWGEQGGVELGLWLG
jgi:hypothetical protein